MCSQSLRPGRSSPESRRSPPARSGPPERRWSSATAESTESPPVSPHQDHCGRLGDRPPPTNPCQVGSSPAPVTVTRLSSSSAATQSPTGSSPPTSQ